MNNIPVEDYYNNDEYYAKHVDLQVKVIKEVPSVRVLRSKADILNLVDDIYANNYRETLSVVGLRGHSPAVIHIISYGTPTGTSNYQCSLFKALLLSNCTGYCLVHNHIMSEGIIEQVIPGELYHGKSITTNVAKTVQ